MKKVLFISLDGMTDPLGQSQVIPYLKGLSTKGHQIHILSAEKPNHFNALHDHIGKILSESNIIWHHVPFYENLGLLKKNKQYKTILKKAIELNNTFTYDIIHSRSYPASLIALQLKRKSGTPFLFDMRGLWADERIDGGIWNINKIKDHILYKYFKRKEKSLLNESKHIISLTHAAKKHITTSILPSLNPNKITVIPCCVDLNEFFPLSNGKSVLPAEKQNQKIVLYSGSIGTWYLTHEMLVFFKAYLSVYPNALFLMITKGNTTLVLEEAKKLSIDQDKLMFVALNRNEMNTYLNTADIALNFIKPAFSKIASSPVKLGEYLACGIPTVCNTSIGDIDQQAKSSKSIVLLNSFDTSEFSSLIPSIPEKKDISESARKFAKENLSLNYGIEKYNEVYAKF